MRVEIELENTNIKMSCTTPEELYKLYWYLGNEYVFIVNGEKLQQDTGGSFAGYSRKFFDKFFEQ